MDLIVLLLVLVALGVLIRETPEINRWWRIAGIGVTIPVVMFFANKMLGFSASNGFLLAILPLMVGVFWVDVMHFFREHLTLSALLILLVLITWGQQLLVGLINWVVPQLTMLLFLVIPFAALWLIIREFLPNHRRNQRNNSGR